MREPIKNLPTKKQRAEKQHKSRYCPGITPSLWPYQSHWEEEGKKALKADNGFAPITEWFQEENRFSLFVSWSSLFWSVKEESWIYPSQKGDTWLDTFAASEGNKSERLKIILAFFFEIALFSCKIWNIFCSVSSKYNSTFCLFQKLDDVHWESKKSSRV